MQLKLIRKFDCNIPLGIRQNFTHIKSAFGCELSINENLKKLKHFSLKYSNIFASTPWNKDSLQKLYCCRKMKKKKLYI